MDLVNGHSDAVQEVTEKVTALDLNENEKPNPEPAAGDTTTTNQTTTAPSEAVPAAATESPAAKPAVEPETSEPAADSTGSSQKTAVSVSNKLSGLGLKPEVQQTLTSFALGDLTWLQEEAIRSFTEQPAGSSIRVTVLESGTERAITFVAKAAIMQQLDPETLEHQLLILTANRYAALQVTRVVRALADPHKLRARACIGGDPLHNDTASLRTGVQIVIGTTGRITDLLERCILNTSYFKVLVLENADEMLSSQKYEVYAILKKLPADVQIILLTNSPQEPDALMKEMDSVLNATPEDMEKHKPEKEFRARSGSRTGRRPVDQNRSKRRNLKRRRQSGGSSSDRTEDKGTSAESSPSAQPVDQSSPVIVKTESAVDTATPVVAATA
jgi:hypothetical protein